MEQIFAVINGGIVENIMIANQNFVDAIAAQHDFILRIDELDPMPCIGWLYDGENFSES